MKREDIPESRCALIKISSGEQYLEVLEKIRKQTEKIVIVQIDGPIKNDPIVQKAWELLHLEKKEIVNEWYGTIAERSRGAVQYTFNAIIRNRRAFFEFLASFDSFWDGIEVLGGDAEARFDDIAFLDRSGELLFYSTTHEDEFWLNKKFC